MQTVVQGQENKHFLIRPIGKIDITINTLFPLIFNNKKGYLSPNHFNLRFRNRANELYLFQVFTRHQPLLGDSIVMDSQNGFNSIQPNKPRNHNIIYKQEMESGSVYSTEHGRMCPNCEKPIKDCICSQNEPLPEGDGIVRIGRETKGRKGKGVTTITGIPLTGKELKQLAKKLKQKCSSGGTIVDHTIEIQGDHRETLKENLKKMGYTVKVCGS